MVRSVRTTAVGSAVAGSMTRAPSGLAQGALQSGSLTTSVPSPSATWRRLLRMFASSALGTAIVSATEGARGACQRETAGVAPLLPPLPNWPGRSRRLRPSERSRHASSHVARVRVQARRRVFAVMIQEGARWTNADAWRVVCVVVGAAASCGVRAGAETSSGGRRPRTSCNASDRACAIATNAVVSVSRGIIITDAAP